MKILAVDTATKSCSVAIIDARVLVVELTILKDQTHSKHLMEFIDTALKIAGLNVAELDGLSVTLGPGSFTGLRIGISTVKGLAHALKKPVVGVSSLDVLAWQCADRSFLICPLVDARKGEVYFAKYRFNHGQLTKESAELAQPPDAAVNGIKEPCVFIGNGALIYREVIGAALGSQAHFVPENQNIIRASTVAFLSLKRFNINDTDEIASLSPHYIRKPDAELSHGNH
jgi:tRNA threonylcarbamoyladenosine biosynthesis protein TsaB